MPNFFHASIFPILTVVLPRSKSVLVIPLMLLFYSFNHSAIASFSGFNSPTEKQKSFFDGPLLFIENKGQLRDNNAGQTANSVLFYTGNNSATVFVTKTGLHYQFSKSLPPDRATGGSENTNDAPRMETHRYTVNLKNANPNPVVRKEEEALYTERHINAGNAEALTAKSYRKVILENVYPGIDWVLYTGKEDKDNQSLKYDFVVKPGADPSLIQLEIEHADDTYLDETGAMVMKTKLGEVTELAPVSYSGSREISTKFRKIKKNVYGFELGIYDSSRTLIIDPEVRWLTYYTGVGVVNDISDVPAGSATDQSGNVYLVGTTQSATNIAHNGYQNDLRGSLSAIIVKFSGSGERLWATYLGGASMEFGQTCVIAPDNGLYFALKAHSAGLPATTGAHQSALSNHGSLNSNDAYDIFLGKFSATGALLWATYFGGDHADKVLGCASDANGNLYLTGETKSINLPTDDDSFQRNYSGESDRFQYNAFLAKFSATGQFQWTTYYAATERFTHGNACAADAAGNVYMTGRTVSGIDVSPDAFQPAYGGGGGDAFLTKFDTNGKNIWTTYLGGTSSDEANACVVDPAGNVYIAGNTTSADFPVLLPFQSTFGGGNFFGDAFLAKFNPTGTLLWSTYYGGEDYDQATSCAIDAVGNVYLGGRTNSTTGIAFNGILNSRGAFYKGFVAKFTAGGHRLWGSYLGGNLAESIKSISTDNHHNLYLIGASVSSDLATPDSFKPDNTYGTEAYFVAKVFDDAHLAAPVVFVNKKATGANNGTSWTNAYTSLQDALASVCGGANTVSEQTQIWVAADTYYPDEGAGLTSGDRSLSFELCDKSAVYGGFNGTEANLSDRNIASNVTILSGDIDKNNTRDNHNSFNVARVRAGALATVLDGFTVTKGNADIQNCNANPAHCNGGGLYAANGSSPAIRNVRFIDNYAKQEGGGLSSSYSRVPLKIVNSVFQQNTAGVGGGLSIIGGRNEIVNSLITANSTVANIGGGIEASGTDYLRIINSTITANTANTTLGDNGTAGGGMSVSGFDNVSIMNSIIWGNSSGIRKRFATSEVIASYSLIQGSDGSSGTGNINGNTNPGFVNAGEGNYQLAVGSPLVNKGDQATEVIPFPEDISGALVDLAGSPRFYGPRIDIGAYELIHESALPVLLANFSASLREQAVLLTWQTTEEINASHFEIQRSTDAGRFEVVGNVPVKSNGSNSYSLSSYSFEDLPALASGYFGAGDPGAITLYYRLRIVDLDGSQTFSSIVSVKASRGGQAVTLYPNPVRNEKVTIRGSAGWIPAGVRAFDLLGKPVNVSIHRDELDISYLPAGLYLVKVENSDGTILTLKLLKQ